METVAAFSLNSPVSILLAVIGLGFVIFVHELGHFAVAKWCGVRVYRFSIGLGPVAWSFNWGETEYALSWIPFGGYVYMMGQDDVDPSRMTDVTIAQDPRSYTAKSVPQRMAIISAGVIMNLLTAPLFFAGALMLGQESIPALIGQVTPGSPAWQAGLQPGDQITKINDKGIQGFDGIFRRVLLDGGEMKIQGVHANRQEFTMQMTPAISKLGGRPALGVAPSNSLTLARSDTQVPHVLPGTAAALAAPKLEPGDKILEADGKPVKDFLELQRYLVKNRSKKVELLVEHAPLPGIPAKKEKVSMPANPFVWLGMHMDIGQISAVRKGSPADGKLQVGDKITHVIFADSSPREVGRDLDPLRLPSQIDEQQGKKIRLKIVRQTPGTDAQTLEVELIPEDRPGWLDPPVGPDAPLSINSIGVACHVLHTVLRVEAGSPADGVVKPKDQLQKIVLQAKPGASADGAPSAAFEIKFDNELRNWPFAFWAMQLCPERTVKLTLVTDGKVHEETITPTAAKDWYSPARGMHFEVLTNFRKETKPLAALTVGASQVQDFGYEIYQVLYSLFSGRLSWRELRGPIGIVGAAVTQSKQGLAHLFHFLGYLSVNLAVMNFLPIPVLDGGHMVFLLAEGLRGKPLPPKVIVAGGMVGFAFLAGMIVLVLYLDIFVHWLQIAK